MVNHKKQLRKKGFTLAELLVAIAIIGILVAISIPVFTGQLEKAREATDIANVRVAYSEVLSDAITENTSSKVYDAGTKYYAETVHLKQKVNGFQTKNVSIAGITQDDGVRWVGQVRGEGTCTVIFDADTQNVILNWGGYTVKNGYWWDRQGNKVVLSTDYGKYQNWPANAVANPIDAKINANQKITVGALTDMLRNSLSESGQTYRYEIGYYAIDSDGKILVNSGYKILGDQTEFEITTDTSKLGIVNENEQQVFSGATDGRTCQICIQLFKVKMNGDSRSGSVRLTNEEAAELSKLISFDTGD